MPLYICIPANHEQNQSKQAEWYIILNPKKGTYLNQTLIKTSLGQTPHNISDQYQTARERYPNKIIAIAAEHQQGHPHYKKTVGIYFEPEIIHDAGQRILKTSGIKHANESVLAQNFVDGYYAKRGPYWFHARKPKPTSHYLQWHSVDVTSVPPTIKAIHTSLKHMTSFDTYHIDTTSDQPSISAHQTATISDCFKGEILPERNITLKGHWVANPDDGSYTWMPNQVKANKHTPHLSASAKVAPEQPSRREATAQTTPTT